MNKWLVITVALVSNVYAEGVFDRLSAFNQRNRYQIYTAFKNVFLKQIGQTPVPPTPSSTDKKSQVTLNEFKGLPIRVHELVAMLKMIPSLEERNFDIEIPRGCLFSGASGSGKTAIALALAQELNWPCEYISGTSFADRFIGDGVRKVQELFERLRVQQRVSLLIIDDIEAIGATDTLETHPEYRNTALKFLSELDNPANRNVFVIGITKNKDKLSDEFKHKEHFNESIIFSLPNDEIRKDIIRYYLERKKISVPQDIIDRLTEQSKNFSGRDIRSLISQAAQRGLIDNDQAFVSKLETVFIRAKQQRLEEARRRLAQISSYSIEVKKPEVTFNDVAGEIPDTVKRLLSGFKNPAAYQKLGITLPRGLLLFGLPGTGKTLLAEAFAGEVGASFVHLCASDIVSENVGGGAQRIRSLFDQVRMYVDENSQEKVVVFVDEIDAIGSDRSTSQANQEYKTTLDAFLTQLPNLNPASVFFIGATNRKEDLDSALLRPGRFTTHVEMALPDEKGREAILLHYINKTEHKIYNKQSLLPQDEIKYIKSIVKRTELFSCADLKALIEVAGGVAAKNYKSYISRHDLEQALHEICIQKTIKEQEKGECANKLEYDKTLSLDNIVGVPREIKSYLMTLKSLVKLKEKRLDEQRGLLLYGPPGTGKTTIAKCIGHESGLYCEYILGSQLHKLGNGVEGITHFFARLRSLKIPVVLIIDEMDTIGSKNLIEMYPEYKNMATVFWNELSDVRNKDIYIIGITNFYDTIPEQIKRKGRFDSHVNVDLPNKDQRKAIFELYLRNHGINNVDPAISDEIIKYSETFTGQDIKTFINQAYREAFLKFGENCHDKVIARLKNLINKEHVRRKEELRRLLQTQDGYVFSVSNPTKVMGDLAGNVSKKVNDFLRDFKSPETRNNFEEAGNECLHGLLLWGPPGTGKSSIAQAIAGEVKGKLYTVRTGDLVQKYVGESGKCVAGLFKQARMYIDDNPQEKVIIFLDEIDSLAAKRTGDDNEEYSLALGTLLNELTLLRNDVKYNRSIAFIGATNNEKVIDDALLRRLKSVEIALPNRNDRAAIMHHYLSKIKNGNHEVYPHNASADVRKESLKQVLDETEEFSGSDLQYLIEQAIGTAIDQKSDRLKIQHLTRVLSEVKNEVKIRKERALSFRERQQKVAEEQLKLAKAGNDRAASQGTASLLLSGLQLLMML